MAELAKWMKDAEDYNACVAACERTLNYCQTKGGALAEAEHLKAMEDCIDMCRTTAAMLMRGSPALAHTCSVCLEVCRRCTESCRRLAKDPELKACLDVCERCTKTCEARCAA